MKRTLFFIGGGLILVLLLGFWLYSFLYGSPTNTTPNFTDFGLFDGGKNEDVPTPTPDIPVENNPTVDVASGPLRQLTTKPIIGMQMISLNGNNIMRYAEAGTGHIFDIDLQTGAETRVSQISVPVASEAAFSPSGEWAAIRSGYTQNDEVVVVKISTADDNDTKTILPAEVESFAFGDEHTLYFSEIDGYSLVANSYNLHTSATNQLFTVPFTAAKILWSQSTNTPHYVLTKPAASLTGYLYQVKNGQLARTPISGKGLTSQLTQNHIVFTQTNTTGAIGTYLYNIQSTQIKSISLPTIAEKCVSSVDDLIYCAGNLDTASTELPDSWYRGDTKFNDRLWRHDRLGSNSQIANFAQLSGREIDIIEPQVTPDGKMLYFINKNDQTLWLYEFKD